MKTKLTMVTLNGRTTFMHLPVEDGPLVEVEENILRPDVKVRVDIETLAKKFGIPKNSCICIGR